MRAELGRGSVRKFVFFEQLLDAERAGLWKAGWRKSGLEDRLFARARITAGGEFVESRPEARAIAQDGGDLIARIIVPPALIQTAEALVISIRRHLDVRITQVRTIAMEKRQPTPRRLG
nr:hypothetical protein [Halochromatium salexigens]